MKFFVLLLAAFVVGCGRETLREVRHDVVLPEAERVSAAGYLTDDRGRELEGNDDDGSSRFKVKAKGDRVYFHVDGSGEMFRKDRMPLADELGRSPCVRGVP